MLAWGAPPAQPRCLFIISGFAIYLPTAARDGDFGSVRSFAIRRVARLVPAYYVALLIALLLLATVSSSEGLPGLGSIGAHLTMLQTPGLLVANDFKLGFGVVPPVWTLSVEAGLYLVVPPGCSALLPSSLHRACNGSRHRARLERPLPSRGLRREPLRHLAQLRVERPDRALLCEPVPELGASIRLGDDGRLALCEAARSVSGSPAGPRGALDHGTQPADLRRFRLPGR